MCVYMLDPHFPQPQTNINRLIQPKEIRAATPFIQRGNDIRGELPFF